MKRNVFRLFAVVCACFLPVAARGQCFEASCATLQSIYNSAQVDYRDYRAQRAPALPSLSAAGITVPCQMNLWANNVPMYICYSQAPLAGADAWFRSTLQGMKRVQPSWQFKITAAATDQSVDAGPLDCEPNATQGPYSDQCPLHMQLTKQADGSTKLYFILNSLSSPYLFPHPALYHPPAKSGASTRALCDDFCQSFNAVFAARTDAFAAFREKGSDSADTAPALHFAGARKCSLDHASRPDASASGTQFVCRWSEESGVAAAGRFDDIVSHVQNLVPQEWARLQHLEFDNVTGATVKAWSATEPGDKHDVRVYVSGQTVALHITTWN